MGRRDARDGARTTRGEGGGAVAKITGLTGFSAGNFANTAAPGGVAWGATGADAVLFRVQSQAVGVANRSLFSRRQGTAGRWLRTTGTNANISCVAYNGVSVQAVVSGPAIGAGLVGKLLMAIAVLDTTVLRLYFNRGGATSIAIAGHTPGAAPATRAGILDSNLEPGTSIDWFGGAQTDQVISQAQAEAWFDAVKVAKRMVACPGVTTGFVCSVNAAGTGFDGSGDSMSITGSLTVVKRPLVWGW